MGTKGKLIERFKKQPKDFTWDELVRLFGFFGFVLHIKGKTSGSRVMFTNGKKRYFVHKPHPQNIIKERLMKHIFDYLTYNKFI